MWRNLEKYFASMPSQAEVANYILKTGIRVENDKLYFDKVTLSYSQVANALDKDKRVVAATVRTIKANNKLYEIFSLLSPTCNLINMAVKMGWGVIGVDVCDSSQPGMIGRITSLLGDHGISIRQALCPATTAGMLYIITQDKLPEGIIDKLMAIKNIGNVTVIQN